MCLPQNRGELPKEKLIEGALHFFYWNRSLCSSNERDSYFKITLAPAWWASRRNEMKGRTGVAA
jgi:hypothetical protein